MSFRPHPASRIAVAVIALAALFPPGAWAGTDPISAEIQAVFQRSARAVVKIQAQDPGGELYGTGFFIDPNGTIYTNYSVGGESRDIVVSDGVARYPATRIAADARSGLAILKIEAQKTPFLPLGKSSGLTVASMVMAVGYPLDLPLSPNIGCVGGFGISSGDRFFAVSHIRANVPVQRGEGGAPVLNMDGEVVGIVESSLEGGAGCFVLPIEAAEKVRSDVIRFGEPRPGWLGIKFGKSDGSDSPIEVTGLLPDSPSEKAGIQPKDVLVKVGDRKVSSLEDVLNAAFYLTAGDEVPLTVLRDGKTTEINVRCSPNPLTVHQEVVSAPPVFNFSVHLGN